MQPNITEVTEKELKSAYQRTGLNRVGYSFQKAMQCELTKKCLVRMALNAQSKAVKKDAPKVEINRSKKAVRTMQYPPFWWQKY